MDSFMAFNQFTMCCLRLEETVDQFLIDLQCLAMLVGEVLPECWMKGTGESCQGTPLIVNQDGIWK